jgi:hypothetical protein
MIYNQYEEYIKTWLTYVPSVTSVIYQFQTWHSLRVSGRVNIVGSVKKHREY